jgi:glycosyltransferase involved in cell wall biosynthesis
LTAPHRVLFLYWGRRGLTGFAHEVGRAASINPNIAACISVSRQNECFGAFNEFAPRLLAVDTFATNAGAVTQAWRIPFLRRRLTRFLAEHHIEAVIELMPHVWSSLVLPCVKASGARYATIIHDAEPHPGDYRSLSIKDLIDRSIAQADIVLTLSEAVAERLVATGRLAREKVLPLFHPDLDFGALGGREPPRDGEPLRLAFLGRIIPYKGLPLFLDTVDKLRQEGIAVEVGVFGEGALGPSESRLRSMRAEVVNRWLSADEISTVLSRFHAVMLSHIEASQSGIVAMAFGAGLPVIASPVGGLVEQVEDGVTGTLAQRADAPALAEAAKRLLLNPQLYGAVCGQLAASRNQRSMSRFVDECVAHVIHAKIASV